MTFTDKIFLKCYTTHNADAGGPTADAGGPTADAGGPTADAGDPTADAGDPTADAGDPSGFHNFLKQGSAFYV